jgi:PPM family protein phosphatase
MGYSFTKDCMLMVVADGMGGHDRGELAAELSMRSLAQSFQLAARPRIADPAAFLDHALRAAHRAILEFGSRRESLDSPRTTIVVCLVQDGFAWWAHAGDSRLYLIRRGRAMMRTRDHSKVQSLLSLGLLKPEEAEKHPERNKVLNCLGAPVEPTIELSSAVPLEPRDILLLCSDGVWGELNEVDLVAGLTRSAVAVAVPDIVQRAVSKAGPTADNATAIAMVWGGAQAAASDFHDFDVPDGAVTTTIIMAPLEGQVMEAPMAEDDIERTIAEIQSAIGKTQGKD